MNILFHCWFLLYIYYFLAFIRELGNFEAAAENFQKALMLNQNHVQTIQLGGMLLYHHGNLDEALKNFKVSIYSADVHYEGCIIYAK